MMHTAHSKRKSATRWGNLAALLAACFATLAGVFRGIDPDVILWRATLSAVLVGALTAAYISAAGWVRHRVAPK